MNHARSGMCSIVGRFSFREDKIIRSLVLLIAFFVVVSAYRLLGQESIKPLSPTESYKAAIAPYTATRSQANDLTDADKFALGIGIAQASRDCVALSADSSSFTTDAKELFALAQLCIFGQQFESARAAAVHYLALPEPPKREQALLLLVRAYLGLKQPESAEPQVASLLRDYPYDASIHAAMNQLIENTENSSADLNGLALNLCVTQGAATLPLLVQGKTLEGKDGSASASQLFADAVRCSALADSSGKPSGLEKIAAIVQQPSWAGTADLALMQAALERQKMVGKSSPLMSLHGYSLTTNRLIPTVTSLKHGPVLLLPFTVWSPSTPEIASDLVQLAPQLPIYAITSWRSNTGRGDDPSREVLEQLRSWQKAMPKKISILVVPDSVLSDFHSDVFPIGILIRSGTVLSNLVLSGPGAERMVISALSPAAGTK